MNLVDLMNEKFNAQSKYDHEVIIDRGMRFCFRLGDAAIMIYGDDVLAAGHPTKEKKHGQICIRKQSIICPECGEFVLVEKNEIPYEGTEWDAFCKKCSWSSDDNREPLSEWLDKNDYYYICDCPIVEVPPAAPWLARTMYETLLHSNEKTEAMIVVDEQR